LVGLGDLRDRIANWVDDATLAERTRQDRLYRDSVASSPGISLSVASTSRSDSPRSHADTTKASRAAARVKPRLNNAEQKRSLVPLGFGLESSIWPVVVFAAPEPALPDLASLVQDPGDRSRGSVHGYLVTGGVHYI